MNIWQRLVNLEEQAKNFGLKWPDAISILKQIESECQEIRQHLEKKTFDTQELREEIGDLLHASMSLAWFMHFDAQDVLEKACDKFQKRLEMMQCIAKEQGKLHLQDKDFMDILQLWLQAKSRLQNHQ